MSTEMTQSESKPESAEQTSGLFAVGDRVIAAKAISDGPTEDRPAQDYCRKGDELEIREVRGSGWYVVAHPRREKGAGFWVLQSELSPAIA